MDLDAGESDVLSHSLPTPDHPLAMQRQATSSMSRRMYAPSDWLD